MVVFYRDYYWKEGKPHGIQPVDARATLYAYRILTDPYHKRYSIEKYHYGTFDKVVYDSLLLDFRHINPTDQVAWQREILKEDSQTIICLLRNQDDRAILVETHTIELNRCRSCLISSIHGISLSKHCMYYRASQDSFDGVILYDVEDHPVMKKTYQIDPETGEFSFLLTEEWNMQHASFSPRK